MKRDVSARIGLDVTEPADLVFAVAVADRYHADAESLTVTLDGAPLTPRELGDAHGTRLHRVTAGIGRLVLQYAATVDGEEPQERASETDLLVYSRPSRYAESDRLDETAHAEFRGIDRPEELLAGVASWVGTRLSYVSGSSRPTDGAVETLLSRAGVCRDYSHLVIALLRALGVPARLVAVYAPGVTPMDFHAVAEAWIDGRWCAIDATTLAPRRSLVRIATGRDAADTAFLNVMSGRAELKEVSVMAVADVLPSDDVTQLVSIS